MPTGRRARGELEYAADRWCKIWLVDGCESDCTPSWIAHRIVDDEKRPVTVASIRSILERWAAAGYANIGFDPLRFVSLTPEGMQLGYEELYRRTERDRRVSHPCGADEAR